MMVIFDITYGHCRDEVMDAIHRETFDNDIGQNSWMTVDEYDRFIGLLNLGSDAHVLEVASGSGGPALYLATKCGGRVTGIDANESGINTATDFAAKTNARGAFTLPDDNARLTDTDINI